MEQGGCSIKDSGRHAVDEITSSEDCITPKTFGHMHMQQESSGNIMQVLIVVLSNTIIFGARTSGLVDKQSRIQENQLLCYSFHIYRTNGYNREGIFLRMTASTRTPILDTLSYQNLTTYYSMHADNFVPWTPHPSRILQLITACILTILFQCSLILFI